MKKAVLGETRSSAARYAPVSPYFKDTSVRAVRSENQNEVGGFELRIRANCLFCMAIEIKMLSEGEEDVLQSVAPGTFDNAIDTALTREFLRDARHHIIVALEGDVVVGFVSAVDYVHPDKARELWINEVGVGDAFRKRGIATALMRAMLAEAKRLGCTEAWLGTERSNTAAVALYDGLEGKQPLEDALYYTWEVTGNLTSKM